MTSETQTLVIENDPTDDLRRLGGWLADAGLDPVVVRPHAGEPLPAELTGYAAFVVLGGAQHAYGEDRPDWFDGLESLLRKAVRYQIPTLGICLGGQLLALAHAGQVGPAEAGPEIGARLVARRDAADADPLFAEVPLLADVFQWHHDEVTALPIGAVLMAASTYYPHQAFRVGEKAWGTQFHIEVDTAMVADWVSTNGPLLAELELDPADVVARADAAMTDLEEVWRPFTARFAALARGELRGPRRELPLLGL